MASRGGFLVGDGALRRRRTSQKTNISLGKPAKTIKRKKKKPEWDSTVQDLNVHKATEEEVNRRHQIHKSKNAGILEEQRQARNKENSPGQITTPNSAQRKQAILQEILYGHNKFQDVLAESDKTMSVVKDLFGDDPKKYLGFPNITMPPQNQEADDSGRLTTGPIAEIPETPTHLEILSDSVMRTPALNDVSGVDEGSSPEAESPSHIDTNGAPQRFTFEPKLDLQRFKQFVSEEQIQHGQEIDLPSNQYQNLKSQRVVMSEGPGKDQQPVVVYQQSGSDSFFSGAGNGSVLAGDPNFMRQAFQQSTGEATAASAIPANDRSHEVSNSDTQNETSRAGQPRHLVKKTSKTRHKAVDKNTSSASGGLKSLEDLKNMVESLEDEIAEYEMETGRQPTNTTKQTSSFSGYTSALIMAVTKLMRYLKESELQRRAETVMSDQILQGFAEQRALIDALTNDIMLTQEQNTILKEELHSYRMNTGQQLDFLKHELHTVLKSFEYHTVQSTINALHSTKPVSLQSDTSNMENVPGNYRPQAVSGQKSRLQTQGAYIPVSQLPDNGSEQKASISNDPYDSTVPGLGRHAGMETEITRNEYNMSKVIQPQPTILTQQEKAYSQDQVLQAENYPTRNLPNSQHQIQMGQVPSKAPLSSVQNMRSTIQNPVSLSTQPFGIAGRNSATGGMTVNVHPPSLPGNGVLGNNQFSQNIAHDLPMSQGPSFITFDDRNQITLQPMQPLSSEDFLTPGPSDNQITRKGQGVKLQQENFKPLGGRQILREASHTLPKSAINATTASEGIQGLLPKPTTQPRLTNQNDIPKQHAVDLSQSLLTAAVEKTSNPGCKADENDNHLSKMDDSLMAKSFKRDQQATEELRQRLEVIALKQKNVAAMRAGFVGGMMEGRKGEIRTAGTTDGQTVQRPSPHVHFKDPLVASNGPDNPQQVDVPKISPSVSPIPFKVPSVPPARKPRVGVVPERRVVVNLPSAWSDVSSTNMSL